MAAARVTSVATHRFWNLFYALPANVQALAVKSTACGNAILTIRRSTSVDFKAARIASRFE